MTTKKNKEEVPLEVLIDECIALSETGDFHLERNTINSKETFIDWGASVDCFKSEPYISGKTPRQAINNLIKHLKGRK